MAEFFSEAKIKQTSKVEGRRKSDGRENDQKEELSRISSRENKGERREISDREKAASMTWQKPGLREVNSS